MKKFSLEPINKQIQEMLEEILVELQKFEELKDCYVENNYISINDTKILMAVRVSSKGVVIDNGWQKVWKELPMTDVFDKTSYKLTTLKIKEPQPHQARKKTLEELEVGDSYYKFNSNVLLIDDKINNRTYWNKCKLGYEDEVESLKNLIKYSRLFVALDEEEIKNKVLD